MADDEQRGREAQQSGAYQPGGYDGTTMFDEVGAKALSDAYLAMVQAAKDLKGLPERERLLILCGAFVARGQRGGFVYHAELGLRENKFTRDELIQAVLINMVGSATFAQVCDALCWVKQLKVNA